jgi:hypothetical protein
MNATEKERIQRALINIYMNVDVSPINYVLFIQESTQQRR